MTWRLRTNSFYSRTTKPKHKHWSWRFIRLHCSGVQQFIFHPLSVLISFIYFSLSLASCHRCSSQVQPSDCDSPVFHFWNPHENTPNKVKRVRPLEPLEGSPVLTDKEIHSERNICQGESKRHSGESRPQKQHACVGGFGNFPPYFTDFPKLTLGLIIFK